MSVNLSTLDKIKESALALPLYKILGNYIFEYVTEENHEVNDQLKNETLDYLEYCNSYARKLRLKDLCDMYNLLNIEQDIILIYDTVSSQLVKEQFSNSDKQKEYLQKSIEQLRDLNKIVWTKGKHLEFLEPEPVKAESKKKRSFWNIFRKNYIN